MEKLDLNSKENAIVSLNAISKLVEEVEKKVKNNTKIKECKELKDLKEKCCDSNINISVTAFHGINSLVKKNILVGSRVVSMYVSLVPGVKYFRALVSAIGDILVYDLKEQISQKGFYECPYNKEELKHPFIEILNHNREKTWFEIYIFVLKLLQNCDDIKLEDKIKFLRSIFRHLFWSSSWRGSQLQSKIFSALLSSWDQKEMKNFTLEILMWQDVDIHYCLFLQELFLKLFTDKKENHLIISGLTPTLAASIRWLITNGHDPSVWMNILVSCIEMDDCNNSIVLFLLTDVLLETPSCYINFLIDVCKAIIFSCSCSKYVVYKFIAIILNWYVNPCSLAYPLYKNIEKILAFVKEKSNEWTDKTYQLMDNKFYTVFGRTNKNVSFAVDLILASSRWTNDNDVIFWLKNLMESNSREMQLKLHTFIYGIILISKSNICVDLSLEILSQLITQNKEISFSFLCLMFYKLGSEMDPIMQRTFLFSLPKSGIKKENISLVVGIIESLKKSRSRVMTPLVIQLYLELWKLDNRTYSYLHKMLHDCDSQDFGWELNVSKALALREISRTAPHLHAKDLVAVLSKILNECSGHVSGLPSAIAIEAVTELCKSYVIDILGTWNAIQPKLHVDRRPQVVISLCKFFEEIPNLNSSEQKYNQLTLCVVPMLWNYIFYDNPQITGHAFRALSAFNVENLPLKLLPELFRMDIKLPKDHDKVSKDPVDIMALPYVPAQCWVQFLEKIDDGVVDKGGDMLMIMIDRELNSLPRGLFYQPPEKSEPLSYSYLPPRSICRALVENVQKKSAALSSSDSKPRRLKELMRVISHDYTKTLPPLDWSFLQMFFHEDSDLLQFTLALLARQGSTSKSAKSLLDNYLKAVEWTSSKMDQIVFLYTLLPMLCKAVYYQTLQNFLDKTIRLCVKEALDGRTLYFEKVIEELRSALKNENVQPGHKGLLAKQLEKISALIHPDHSIMKSYAVCATQFSVKSIEFLTSIRDPDNVDETWLRRAIIIRREIGLRKDIKNPLIWLNEYSDIIDKFPREQILILEALWTIIRSRRDCNHTNWFYELTWRIQASIVNNNSNNSNNSYEETLFLIDTFVSATILLSGYDFFFESVHEFTKNITKKLSVFPESLSMLLHMPDWTQLLPKVALWLHKLSRWKTLPQEYVSCFAQALLVLKEAKYCSDQNAIVHLFNLYSLPC